jgi:hypothetical protein
MVSTFMVKVTWEDLAMRNEKEGGVEGKIREGKSRRAVSEVRRR